MSFGHTAASSIGGVTREVNELAASSALALVDVHFPLGIEGRNVDRSLIR